MKKILAAMNEVFSRQTKFSVFLQSFILVLIVGIVDYMTGYFLSFSIFYLIPIALAAWFASKNLAILISVMSAITWLLADLFTEHQYPHPLIPFWNAALRLGFFLIVTFLLLSLKRLLERERKYARQDHLTRVFNSRAFHEMADIEIERCRRYKHPMTLVYIDLDNFKSVNDRYGHHVGDQLLTIVGNLIRQNMRTMDIAARLGGDEFAVLLTECDDKSAGQLVKRIQTALLEAMQVNGWPVTFSIGMVTSLQSPNSLPELIKTADTLMYEVKTNGKNEIKHLVLNP